jgi:hypothetical protein
LAARSSICARIQLQTPLNQELAERCIGKRYDGGPNERHKFKIGQLVNYFSRESASGAYQITKLLPQEGDEYQYRIKSVTEPHERVAKEHELRSAA